MTLTHLQRLEAEAIHILREVAECDKPVMLCSIGKDSTVMLHLARKAFYLGPSPFPLLHIDSTCEFREMYELRQLWRLYNPRKRKSESIRVLARSLRAVPPGQGALPYAWEHVSSPTPNDARPGLAPDAARLPCR